jgi:hypothetical protein
MPFTSFISRIPWSFVIVLCLTLGLAPFRPPHVVEKLQMFFRNELQRPIDWLDLVLHGAPWILAVAKALLSLVGREV